MQTVRFRAGETILAQGELGDTAFVIVSGSVEVSVGEGAKAKSLGTLATGDVFGEMSLIEPGPRSATVKAVADVECVVTSYDDFVASTEVEPERAMQLMRTLVRRLRQTNERIARIDPGTGHRIQQWLHVILAGLDAQDALSAPEMESLQRELRMLLQIEHFQIAAAEIEKAEDVLGFMFRPSIEDCLNLWFGKFEQTDQEIWNRFGADVALASRGHFDHWALNVEHPRLLVALVIMLDQFRRNMYRETKEMYACDPRCLALVKRGLRVGVGARLRPIERVFLCLALTHSESLEDQHLCMEEWGRAMEDLGARRSAERLPRDLPPPPRGDHALRQISASEQGVEAGEHGGGGDVPRGRLVPLRPAAGPPAGRHARLRRQREEADRQAPRPRVRDAAAGSGEAAGGFEFEYAGPDAAFIKTQEQLKQQGFVRIGDSVPDFTAKTNMGRINFHEFIGDNWCVLFSHPADFTPVCTTELGAAAKLDLEWKKRGTKIIGLSVDSNEDHERWIADINETQRTRVGFPIIADKDRRVSMLFGMLDPTNFRHGPGLGETMTVRSVFIISPLKRVELILSYPAYVGRSFDEILRVLDALQLSAKYRVATPANWMPGDDTVVLPFISDEEAERTFADRGGVRRVRSYLRYVRDPSLRIF